MRTAPAAREAWKRHPWPRRELRALRMRFSVLDDAAFCLARAGVLTAAQAKAAHNKIERAQDRAFKQVLRAFREEKGPRRVVPAKRAHKLHDPITG